MARIFTSLFLLLTFVIGVQAQKQEAWASARERGLKGVVRAVVSTCSDIDGKHKTTIKYEFSRGGELMVITAPQLPRYDCIVAAPTSYKIIRRDGRGNVTGASLLVHGEVERKERYEYEYDAAGNWVKVVTFVMREYEMEGGGWRAGEWKALYVCQRTVEYYP